MSLYLVYIILLQIEWSTPLTQQLYSQCTQISDSHVSLLLYGMFNASISGEQMSKSYVFDNKLKTW